MPLRESDYDQKFIPVQADTLLSAGMALYMEKAGQEDWHFLVVYPDGAAGALKVSRLRLGLARLGGRLFDLTFEQLPIRVPEAAKGQRQDIGIGVAESRAEDTASGVLAVMDGQQVIGRLDRSVRRSGQEAFPGSNMGSLYGSYINTHQDARAQWRPPGVTPPTCAHCRHQEFHDFDTSRMVYVCRSCGEVN